MHHRSIAVILCMAALLGILFQYNRSDGFLRLLKNTNMSRSMGGIKEKNEGDDALARDRYLLVYDPTSSESLRLRLNIEKTLQQQKKSVKVIPAREVIGQELNYNGIICTVSNWDNIKSMETFREYVRQGGKVYFLITPLPGSAFNNMASEVGFASFSNQAPSVTSGIKMLSNVLLGSKGREFNGLAFKNVSLTGILNGNANLHIESAAGVPLLWQTSYGQGTYVFYNGSNLTERENRGLITGILGLAQDQYVYPVVGIKTVCIDDFPAPIPEGNNEKISSEYQLSTSAFFRQVWWPDMLGSAQKYDIKYTGLIIETYSDNVRPPFNPEVNNGDNRNNLIVYGRELIKSGGELGVHGYNHQPLVLPGQLTEESYKVWANQADMASSITEVKRYIEDVFPGYKLKVYVPPSNILSPDGRKALVEGLPDLRVIASIYVGSGGSDASYLQDYRRSPDGILEMPRLSVDYSRSDTEDWSIYNGITYLGVFSHFVHPDNIFYEENANKSWREMHTDFDSLLKMIKEKFGWLRGTTVSQGAEYFDDYLNLDYRVVVEPNGLRLISWGFRDEAYFVMRSSRKIKSAQGCRFETIGDNVYLLKISSPEVSIVFESEAKM